MTSGEERQEIGRLMGLPIYEDLPVDAAAQLAARLAAAARGEIELCSFDSWRRCDELAIFRVWAPQGKPVLACEEHLIDVLNEIGAGTYRVDFLSKFPS